MDPLLSLPAVEPSEAKRLLLARCNKRRGDWSGIRGNFGPPGEQIDVQHLTVYESLEEVLADPAIDLVDICLPPNLHVDAACRALAAGKHVLCEKPLGLTTAQCDQILAAAKRFDRRVLVAQVLPYMGEFQFAYRTVESGIYGRPRRAYFKRVISPPDWIPNFYNAQEVGGPLIDLHVHDTHFIRLLFGMPRRVMCVAEMRDGIVKYCQTLMEFDDADVSVATSSGVSDQTARPFCHGFEIQFERATMHFELAVLAEGTDSMPLRVLGQDGQIGLPQLGGGDDISAFTAEIDAAVASLKTDQVDPRLDVRNARDAIHICQCLQLSAESKDWVNCR